MKLRSLSVLASIAILAFTLPAIVLASGERANTAGVSMARTFAASGRGLEAVGTNPANLVLPHRGKGVEYTLTGVDSTGPDSNGIIHYHKNYAVTRETPPAMTLSILPFSISVGSDFMNYNIYKEYFTGTDSAGTRVSRYLTDVDKQRILELFPDGVAETHSDFDLRLFGLTIHNDAIGDLAFTVTDRVSVNVDVPKDYAKFAFFGLDSLGSTYSLDGTDVRGWYLRDYAVSYARKIPQVGFLNDFAAGITVKMVQGFAALITDEYSGTFGNAVIPGGGYRLVGNLNSRILRASTDTYFRKDSVEPNPFPAPAGRGFGIDLGVSGELVRGVRFGGSITDIGSVNWTDHAYETVASSSFDMTSPTSEQQGDSLKKTFQGTDTPIDGFSTPLPTTLRLGAAFQVDEVEFLSFLPGQMLVTVDYQQGLRKGPGITTRPRLALGSEWRMVSWLPLRSGVSFGGVDRFNWAAGFGLDFSAFALNVGTENFDMLFTPTAFKQFSFGMGMLIRI